MSKMPEVIQSTMAKVREMVDANTVVGSPISVTADVTLVPISKISLGMASGGADLVAKDDQFGGGAGCGVKVVPVAMVVIQGERVRVLPIDEPAKTAAERAIEQLPGLVDKLCDLIDGKKREIADI